jgi:hypothetical protein
MAGSLNHIVCPNGRFTMDMIENMRDAREALEECFNVIRALTGGDKRRIDYTLDSLNYPTLNAQVDLVEGECEDHCEKHVDESD